MNINITAPINQLGYGIHSYNYMKSLVNEGVDINWNPIGSTQTDDKEFINKIQKEFNRNYPSMMIFHETHMDRFSGDIRIGFPVFECDKIQDYAQLLLQQLDYIFVTSEWAKQTLIKNDVDVPIYVIREGVDPDLYHIKEDKYLDTGKFTFITVGKHEVRKNTDLIIETFINNFSEKKCALISHTYNFFTRKFSDVKLEDHDFQLVTETENYLKYSKNDCDIYFTKPMHNKDLSNLYSSADVGIFTSRAEGWNLPLCEALACGIPCIACNNTAQTEYLGTAEFNQLQGKLVIDQNEMENQLAIDNVWFKGNKGNWWALKPGILEKKMQYSFENKFDNNKISEYIRTNFSWKKTAERTVEVLNEIC